jgi:hypothetical protein
MSHFEEMMELFSPAQLAALSRVQETLKEDPLYLEHEKKEEKDGL